MSSTAQVDKPAKRESGTLFGWLPLADFFHLDTRSLVLFRIGLALMLIYDYADRLPDARAHYSDAGIVPRSSLPRDVSLSVHVLSGSAWWSGLLMVVGLLFAFALLAGYKTRLVLFISWFLLISLHGRNPALQSGGDEVFRLALFWAIFLPLGARFSLDAAKHRAAGGEPAPDRIVSVASAALILQVCMIYLFAGSWKWDPVWRSEGTAVWHALHVDHLTTRIGILVRQLPLGLLKLLSFATVWGIETVAPVLLFVPFATGPLRTFTVLSFIAFHVGLGVCLALGNFPLICVVVWLALLPTWFWDKLSAYLRTPARTGVVVHYDGADRATVGAIAYLRTFLCLPDARWQPFRGTFPLSAAPAHATERPRWAVVDHEGKPHYQFAALTYLLWLSPVWWPPTMLLHIGIVKRAAKRLYQRRAAWPGERLEQEGPPPPPLVQPLGAVTTTIICFLVLYIFAWCARALGDRPLQTMGQVKSVGADGRVVLTLLPAEGVAPGQTVELLRLVPTPTGLMQRDVGALRIVEATATEAVGAPVGRLSALAGDVMSTEPDPPLRRFGRAVRDYFPDQVNGLGIALGLDQTWALFAPSPGRFKGWYVVQGTLRDGRTIDPRRNGAPVSWNRPEVVSETYSNSRWRKFMMCLPISYYGGLQGHYCAYLCREWNARHDGDDQLMKVELFFMREVLDEQTMTFAPAKKDLMFTLNCDPQAAAPASR
jgi:hypothetical protein